MSSSSSSSSSSPSSSSSSSTSSARRNLLYVGAALNAFTAYKHTQLGYAKLFPRLNAALGPDTAAAFIARMCFLLFSTTCVSTALLQLKWAKYGLTTGYDKALLAWFATSQFAFGLVFWIKGVYPPLLPLLGIPAVTVLSQAV